METFARKIQEMASRIEEWERTAPQEPLDAIVHELYTDLTTALEELRVAEEEMRTQSEALFEAQAEANRERLRYKELFEFAPDAYLVTCMAGIVQEANQISSTMLNVPQPYLIRKPLANYIAADDRATFRTLLSQLDSATPTRETREWELCVQPRDKEQYPAAFTATVIHDPQQPKATGIRWLVRNITERKALETNRAQAAAVQGRHDAEEAAIQQQRRFVREVLFAITGGRLALCDSETDLPPMLPQIGAPVTLELSTLRSVRKQVVAATNAAHIPLERGEDMETAVGEAVMNAVKHGGGGTGWVCGDPQAGIVQVWVKDTGTGIPQESLHRATLEKGYTTAGTMGHGFFMMLKTCDRTYLLTSPEGTTVVMEQSRTPSDKGWLSGS